MRYDGKLLADARKELEEIRQRNEAERLRRQKLVYSRLPKISVLEAEMRKQMSELVRLTISKPPDLVQKLEELRQANLQAQADKAELLVENGYPIDYLEPIVSCKKCGDTGSFNGAPCDCLRLLYNQHVTQSLSSLLLKGDESFDRINLTLYPDDYSDGLNTTIRDFMSAIIDECRKYADNFSCSSSNLLLQGRTGLGKTYICACIAGAVSKKGYSVCYDSATSAFEVFERYKFKREGTDYEGAEDVVNRMLDCDLMILDDLGTEMTTSLSNSSLYTLINTRLIKHKPTIINTNLSDDALKSRYSDQICSRLQGSFDKLPFFGNDIRRLLMLQQ